MSSAILSIDTFALAGAPILTIGDDLSITAQISNTGEAGGKARMRFHWSDDELLDDDDMLLGTRAFGEVDAGANTDASSTIAWDALVPFGAGFLIGSVFDADSADKAVQDTAVAEIAFPDGVTDVRPDLVLTDLQLFGDALNTDPKSSIGFGETISIVLSVENAGWDPATATTRFYWSDDDSLDDDDTRIDFFKHDTLAPGADKDVDGIQIKYSQFLSALKDNETVDLDSDADGFLFAVIDAADKVDESDETNNTVSTALTVRPRELADLVPLLPDADSAVEVQPGDPASVEIQVQNLGEHSGRGRVNLYWSADTTWDDTDTLLGGAGVGNVPGGLTVGSRVVKIKFNDVEDLGDGFILGVVDPLDVVEESDETNNVATALDLTVGTRVGPVVAYDDLSVVGGTTIDLGQDVTFSVGASNTGDTAIKTRTKFFWSEDAVLDAGDALLATDTHGKLKAGQSFANQTATVRSIDLAESATSNDGFILAALYGKSGDDLDLLDTEALAVDFATDLDTSFANPLVRDLATNMADDTAVPGKTVKITANVENAGEIGVRSNTVFFWSADDVLTDADTRLGSVKHGLLTSGEVNAVELTISYKTLLGKLGDDGVDLTADRDGFIFAVVDKADRITEDDEANNTAMVALNIDVNDPADLAITAGETDVTELAAREKINVSLDIANQGESGVTARTEFYWSEDQVFDAETDSLIGLNGHGFLAAGVSKDLQPHQLAYSDFKPFAGTEGLLIGVINVVGTDPETDPTNNIWVSDELSIL